jgi:hypothetical protein
MVVHRKFASAEDAYRRTPSRSSVSVPTRCSEMNAADEKQINAAVQEALQTGSLGTFDRLPGELRSIARQRAASGLGVDCRNQ